MKEFKTHQDLPRENDPREGDEHEDDALPATEVPDEVQDLVLIRARHSCVFWFFPPGASWKTVNFIGVAPQRCSFKFVFNSLFVLATT